MKVRPIIMSKPMVLALLAGAKTQTRRIMKNPEYYGCTTGDCPHDKQVECDASMRDLSPYGKPGDLLYVRESLRLFNTVEEETGKHGLAAYYNAGGGDMQTWVWNGRSDTAMIPSIHMPRKLSRLTLELTDIRFQHLNNISHEDAFAEGAPAPDDAYTRKDSFMLVWEKINGSDSWKENPLVWALTFKVHQINVDDFLRGLNK